jgi:hypothetical protein
MDAPLSRDHEWHQANVGGRRDPMADDAMNPGERALRARIGAYAMHGRNDARETTAKARAAFLACFERLADPEGRLPLAERQRRAQQLRSAYFARLALASAKARRARRPAAKGGKAPPARLSRKWAERV